MAEWELIETRKISGKGILKMPMASLDNRAYVLFADVIRYPKNRYVNKEWNPTRSRYANMVFVRGNYALYSLPMEYERQVYDGVNDICGQTLIAVKCAYAGMLESIVKLALAIGETPGGFGITPISVTNLIEQYESLRLSWDEIRVSCYADTALQLRLYRIKYDVCNADYDDQKPAPFSPAPTPLTPIGTAIPNSQPYDTATDNGNSVPFPGDAYIPPPGSNNCQAYVVVIQYDRVGGSPLTRTTTVGGYGPVTGARVSPTDPGLLELQCRGVPAQGACTTYGWYGVFSAGSATLQNVSILTIT